jgi:hypothetical protein
LIIESKKIEELKASGNQSKNSRKNKRQPKSDRKMKIIDYYIKCKSDLKELTQKLKKNYKLYRTNFYEISEFRDYIICLFMFKEKAKYYYEFIQSIKKKIKYVPNKKELDDIEASEDSNKALTKKDGKPSGLIPIYRIIF